MAEIAIVTGGAGGIGTALCERLLAKGFDLVVVGSDRNKLDLAAASRPGRVFGFQADLARREEVERVAELILKTDGLSLFVNNAGVIMPGNYVTLPYAVIERQLEVNLHAPMRLTHAAAQRFSKAGAGAILSIVSASAFVALPGSAAYSAAKFGLRGLLIALAQEVEPQGVKVRSLYPGAVDTAMLRYEATHGGSILNFLNKDVLSADQVADAAMAALDGDRLEVSLPSGDALTSRLICAFPGLAPKLTALVRRQGEAGLQRYLTSRGLTRRADAAEPELTGR